MNSPSNKGVLVLALPIPIVVENFASFYDDQKFQQLLQEKKEAHYADILHQYAAQVEICQKYYAFICLIYALIFRMWTWLGW